MATTARESSGWRIRHAFRAGWMESEQKTYGFDFATARARVARFGEQLEIVHRLLRDDRVDFEGRFYTLRDAPGLHRPDLALLAGGSAFSGTTGPAVRFADEYNTFFATTDEVRE